MQNDEIVFPEDDTKLCAKKTYIKADKLDLIRAYVKIQTRKDTDMLKKLMGAKVFQYPKPIELIKKFLDNSIKEEGIVMDFFSGSGTTAHAVLQLNAERASNKIRYILVQIREDLTNNLKTAKGNREKQTAQNAIKFCGELGVPKYISEIAKERIRRAGKKIKEDSPLTTQDLDVGFRVLKLDSSNMKDVYYKAEDYAQTMIAGLEDNVKEDRTPLDLLFQVMLDLGQELSAKIEEKTIAGKTVWCVEGNNIIACFDSDINDQVVTEIAKLKPLYAVFRDSSFVSDAAAANCEQIFASISPATSRRVI